MTPGCRRNARLQRCSWTSPEYTERSSRIHQWREDRPVAGLGPPRRTCPVLSRRLPGFRSFRGGGACPSRKPSSRRSAPESAGILPGGVTGPETRLLEARFALQVLAAKALFESLDAFRAGWKAPENPRTPSVQDGRRRKIPERLPCRTEGAEKSQNAFRAGRKAFWELRVLFRAGRKAFWELRGLFRAGRKAFWELRGLFCAG